MVRLISQCIAVPAIRTSTENLMPNWKVFQPSTCMMEHCIVVHCSALQYLLIQKSFGQAGRSLSPAHIFLYDDSQAARTGENLFKGFLQLLNTQEELQIMVLPPAIWPNQLNLIFFSLRDDQEEWEIQRWLLVKKEII